MEQERWRDGFTLIEMSVVLVIIGLIVGGILVGRDLIRAAGVRATIAQIEKYNTAVNAFRGKYNALPGDMNAAAATQFGFIARGAYRGEGDGNGVLESSDFFNNATATDVMGAGLSAGETAVFWVDLSASGLIDGRFSTATEHSNNPDVTNANLYKYMPPAKLGGDNFIFAWSGGVGGLNGTNYFGIEAVSQLRNTWAGLPGLVGPGLTVGQANAIDSKIDDGLPQSGNVMAVRVYGGCGNYTYWVEGSAICYSGVVPGAAASASAYTCYDNAGSAANTMQYSVKQNGGAGVNCALSFRFQ